MQARRKEQLGVGFVGESRRFCDRVVNFMTRRTIPLCTTNLQSVFRLCKDFFMTSMRPRLLVELSQA